MRVYYYYYYYVKNNYTFALLLWVEKQQRSMHIRLCIHMVPPFSSLG